jgi:hypothetical protein
MRESSGARSMPVVLRTFASVRDRQRVSAGARASPSWSGGRRRPTRSQLSHATGASSAETAPCCDCRACKAPTGPEGQKKQRSKPKP